LVYFYGFCMDGITFYDTWMIIGTNQCFHRKSALGLIIIFNFKLFVNKFNVRRHLVKFLNLHFVNFAMPTLPTWTIQSRHNGGKWWHPNDLSSLCLAQVCLLPLKFLMTTYEGNDVLLLAKFLDQPIYHFTFSCNKQILREESSFNYWHPLDQVESNIP
jgi:hypothetical protein